MVLLLSHVVLFLYLFYLIFHCCSFGFMFWGGRVKNRGKREPFLTPLIKIDEFQKDILCSHRGNHLLFKKKHLVPCFHSLFLLGYCLQDSQQRVGVFTSSWFPLPISEQYFPTLVPL